MCLVLPSGLLAGLQLLQVPSTDCHVALVLVHAVGEAFDVGGTGSRCLSGGLRVGVQGVIHGLSVSCVGIGGLLLLFDGRG